MVGTPVVLDGTRSTGDPALSCTWSFENATGSIVWDTAKGCKLSKAFESADTKYVRLIVRDIDGDTSSQVRSFAVKPKLSGRSARAMSSAPSAEETDGLVAAYAFDEASGTTVRDASTADNDGRIHGAKRTKVAKGGRALQFDGTDRVSLDRPRGLREDSPVTLEAWLRPAAGSRAGTPVVFDGVGGAAAAEVSGRAFGLAFASGASRDAIGVRASAAANRWTHLALTYDGAQVRVYVNGVLDRAFAPGGALPAGKSALSIGGAVGTGFRGVIDDVRIYSRALSAQELRGDMLTHVGMAGPGS
ncbi:LamG domain-containing protein [Candidatus Solirubrobacter pratensis]|uniref:LamG domain-containing protein n=1 Tax=Candidatus Solirubrobacter pratensis TaxID=1298857 RepID=UPI001E504CCA|nr:LamG domain-containing protein [Candidatus Solirubrobacter pratensis]